MDFDFTHDQYMLRDGVRRFLADHWQPRQLRAANGAFDLAFWNELCTMGLQTLLVPERYGGSGLTFVDLALVLEEFGRALVPAPMVDSMLCADLLSRFGTEEQQQRLLPSIADGSCRVAFAHHEAGHGDTAADVRLTARREGARWKLHGTKTLVPGAAGATHLLVSARPAGGAARVFICAVDRQTTKVTAHRAIDPSALLCRVSFEAADAEVIGPGDAIDDQWDATLQRLLEASTIAAATQMTGIADAALDLAVAYAKERTQFGKPIGSFQAIKHKCADMLVAVESARSTAFYAAWTVAEQDPALPLAVSMAKAAAGDACRLACNEALQIHGGVGFTQDFDIHLFMKRGKWLEYSFGDASFHRERVAAIALGTGTPMSTPVESPSPVNH